MSKVSPKLIIITYRKVNTNPAESEVRVSRAFSLLFEEMMKREENAKNLYSGADYQQNKLSTGILS